MEGWLSVAEVADGQDTRGGTVAFFVAMTEKAVEAGGELVISPVAGRAWFLGGLAVDEASRGIFA